MEPKNNKQKLAPSVLMDTTVATGSGKDEKADETTKDGVMSLTASEELTLETPRVTRLGSAASSLSNFSSVSKSSLKRRRMEDDETENELELTSLTQFGILQKDMIDLIERQRTKASKVTKEVQDIFAKELDKMRQIVTKLALENASLRGKLAERTRTSPKASFSDVVRKQASERRGRIPPVTGATKKIAEKRHTVIVKQAGRPLEKPIDKKNVIMMLNPVREKLKIKTCRSTKRGDIVIEAASAEDLLKITGNQKLVEGGFTLEKPSKRLPKVIIFDIPVEYEVDELKKSILLQNDDRMMDAEKEMLEKHLNLKFKTGKKDKDVANWVFEVDPELRHTLRRLNHLYIDVRRCKVSDYAAISRCYKCQGLGHITKFCSAEADTCGHCAKEGHTFKECPNKAQKQKCVPCLRAKKPHQHKTDKNCPEYKAALEQLRLKTDYG